MFFLNYILLYTDILNYNSTSSGEILNSHFFDNNKKLCVFISGYILKLKFLELNPKKLEKLFFLLKKTYYATPPYTRSKNNNEKILYLNLGKKIF